jgi:hypothetical protein
LVGQNYRVVEKFLQDKENREWKKGQAIEDFFADRLTDRTKLYRMAAEPFLQNNQESDCSIYFKVHCEILSLLSEEERVPNLFGAGTINA